MEICKQQSEMTKEKWRYASSKAMEMEICKQQSETEMRKWRYASSKARLKCAVEICKQQSEIKIRQLPAEDRFKRYGRYSERGKLFFGSIDRY